LEDVVKGKSLKESAIKRVSERFKDVTFEQPGSLAPHLLRTGVNVLEDVSKGKSWKDSAIKRASEGLHNWQSGSGLKRKRRHRDIYD
jgi:hypothetical protein